MKSRYSILRENLEDRVKVKTPNRKTRNHMKANIVIDPSDLKHLYWDTEAEDLEWSDEEDDGSWIIFPENKKI